MNNRFFNTNYAIMRHGKVDMSSNLHESSQDVCRRVVKELLQRIYDKPFRIIHSPAHRAEVTARFVEQELLSNGRFVIEVRGANWLGCNTYLLEDKQIADVAEDDGIFTLLVSHEPDIENYLCRLGGVPHCSVFAAEFEIAGHAD